VSCGERRCDRGRHPGRPAGQGARVPPARDAGAAAQVLARRPHRLPLRTMPQAPVAGEFPARRFGRAAARSCRTRRSSLHGRLPCRETRRVQRRARCRHCSAARWCRPISRSGRPGLLL